MDERFVVRVAGGGVQLDRSRSRDDLAIVTVRDQRHDGYVCLEASLIDYEASRNGIEKSGPIGLVTVTENLVGSFFCCGDFLYSKFRDWRKKSKVAVL